MTIGVAYFGNRILRHVAADMAGLAARGFTGVLHTMSENDLAWYRATLGEMVAISKAAGLEVVLAPWGLGGVFGGEADSGLAGARPEAAQVLDDGSPAGAACPNSEPFRAAARAWADAALEAGADALLWDEPHWVGPDGRGAGNGRWGCRCVTCAARFEERFGVAMPGTLTPEVRAFRRACLVELLGELVGHVAGAGGRSTVCLLPEVDEGDAPDVAHWEAVARLPGLTTLASAPYWEVFGRPVEPFVRRHARRVDGLARRHGIGAQLWIQGFRLGPGQSDDVRRAVETARSEGIADLWVWGYEACAHMSGLAGPEPARLWGAVCAALLDAPATRRSGPPGDPLAGRAAEGGGPPLAEASAELDRLVTEGHRAELGDLDLRPTAEVVRIVIEGGAAAGAAVASAAPAIAAAAEAIAAALGGGGRLVYVGAGSAGRLGVLDAAECGPTFGAGDRVVALLAGGPGAFSKAREGAEDDAAAGAADLAALPAVPGDVVVGISASGRTPYVLGALRAARAAGIVTVGVACQPGSALSALVDHPIEATVGPEVISGSTRLAAGGAQKLVLNALSTAAMVRWGRTYGNLMVDASTGSAKLARRARRTVALAAGVEPERAEAALEACDGEVKTAIASLLAGVAPGEARRALEEADGVLRRALVGLVPTDGRPGGG